MAKEHQTSDSLISAHWNAIGFLLQDSAAQARERIAMRQFHSSVFEHLSEKFATALDNGSSKFLALGATCAYGVLGIVYKDKLKDITISDEQLLAHKNMPSPFIIPSHIHPNGTKERLIQIAIQAIQEKNPLLGTFATKALQKIEFVGESSEFGFGPETAFLTGVYEIADIFPTALLEASN